MLKKASDIKPGDIIRIEYGNYNNWVRFTVDDITLKNEDAATVSCHAGNISEKFDMQPDSIVEVVS